MGILCRTNDTRNQSAPLPSRVALHQVVAVPDIDARDQAAPIPSGSALNQIVPAPGDDARDQAESAEDVDTPDYEPHDGNVTAQEESCDGNVESESTPVRKRKRFPTPAPNRNPRPRRPAPRVVPPRWVSFRVCTTWTHAQRHVPGFVLSPPLCDLPDDAEGEVSCKRNFSPTKAEARGNIKGLSPCSSNSK